MNIINCTPHTINLVSGEAEWAFPPSGHVARCAMTRTQTDGLWSGGEHVADRNVIPVNRVGYGPVEGLPDPSPGTVYLVSSLVAQAVPDRLDVLVPDDTIRDETGRIVGCRAFAKI